MSIPRLATKPMDNLHYSTRTIDGYPHKFKFIFSEREAGKSTYVMFRKVFKHWYYTSEPSYLINRFASEFSVEYLTSIQDMINKWLEEPIEFIYRRADIGNALLDIYIEDRLFLRCVALNGKMRVLKQSLINNPAYIVFDEFIINPKTGEKYLPKEVLSFNEFYNTVRRNNNDIVVYFLGNPYSLFNPYFQFFGVNPKRLKRGSILAQNNCVIEPYEITPQLRAHILRTNPLYQFDNTYMEYAFYGQAINDKNALIEPLPRNAKLLYVFNILDEYIGVFTHPERAFYIKSFKKNQIGKKTQVFCFDFIDITTSVTNIKATNRASFVTLKLSSYTAGQVAYSDINAYYLLEGVLAYL